MAKIKISALAEELNREAKEIVVFLQDQGVEAAKRSTSSVEEEDAEKAFALISDKLDELRKPRA